MQNTDIRRIKKSNKLLFLIVLGLFFLTIAAITLCFGSTGIMVSASSVENSIEQSYLSAHYIDGTMGMILDESCDSMETAEMRTGYANLQKTAVRSSGLSDEQSIVAVFLGDGFTIDEQQDFLERVKEIADYMVTVEPFNYYKDYLTVYAVHSISNESGISGELGGTFACRNGLGEPTTAQCTPVDSSVFNCEHGKDTYYHSYYQWRSSANRVILEMKAIDRARAREDALAACSSVDMIQIIANSGMRGGTGQMPTEEQPLGVALTSINYANSNGDWKQVIMHEFGHAFGGLWDEYWNGITPSEYPNMTKNANSATVKWNQWIGYKGVGVYPFAATEWDGNPNQATDPWYRPHQNCIMRQTNNPYCLVCSQALLDKMEMKTGVTLSDIEEFIFNITEISSTYIRIDSLNVAFEGGLTLPERFDDQIVIEIGEGAFANQTGITQVYLPDTVSIIEDDAFAGCANLQYVEGLGVASIGARAFKNCDNLETAKFSSALVTIYAEAFAGDESLEAFLFDDTTENPSNLRTIFTSAFDGCTSLYRFGEWRYALELPAGVETVGSGAFYGTAFQYVEIGANVDEIGSRAFAQMYAMTSITVASGNTKYTTSGGALYDTRGYLLQYAPYSARTSFTVPTSVNGVAIKYIDNEAFMGAQNLVSVHLGNVEQIGARAFAKEKF